jgi:uncharacterized protein (DUF697 family)
MNSQQSQAPNSDPRPSIDPQAASTPTVIEAEVIDPPTGNRQSSEHKTDAQFPGDFPAAIAQMGMKLGEVMGSTALSVGKAAIDTTAGVGGAIGNTAIQTGKVIVDTATGVGEIITHTTNQTGKTTIEAANHTSQTVVDVAVWIGEVAKWMGESTAKQLYQLLEQTTQGTGQAVTFVGNNPLVRRLSGVLKLDWLVGISDRVDLQKATTAVKKLQQQYPDEAPSQIAHRIMVEKALYAGGLGFVSSVVPGAALALLAVDLAATTALQTEMVYQIAAAYGLDLQDPARKGEILAIFGLALGGSKALRAGAGFLRNVPLAGAMIGASTNATMLYTLGYAACRFYEAKQNAATPEPPIAALETLKQESDRYLEVAIAQQAVMDQILVHMVLASYPEKTWEDILPDLKQLHLSEGSLQAIEQNIQSPQPMGALLGQLNQDFAIPLLAQCYRIAQTGEQVSEAEQQVLEAIAEKFSLDLDAIRQGISGKPAAAIENLQRVSKRE